MINNDILLEKVESSNIDMIGHDDNTLVIVYKSGSVYLFKDVPREIYDDFLKAESKGKFMNSVIKPNYKYERLN